MPNELKKLTRQISWRIALFMTASNALMLLGWLGLHETLGFSFTLTAAALVVSSVLLALVFAASATTYAIEPIQTLWQAIMHVAPSQSHVPAPQLNQLQIGRELIPTLVGYIYDLASSSGQDAIGATDSQSYFQAVAGNLPLPLLVLDANGTIQYANQRAGEYFKFDAQALKSKPFDDVFALSFPNSDTLESWQAESRRNAVTATKTWERIRFTPAGAPSPLQFDLAAHYSKRDSHEVETVLVFFDHTKLYEIDDRDIGFVSMAVHELRTPLTIMRGYIEVFEDELSAKLNDEQKQFMHNMVASSQQLTSIVSNILNVARLEENQLVIQLKEENWREVLESVCKDMSLRAKVHQKELEIHIAPDLPSVAVDRVSAYEVIVNLLDNAIKYSPNGSKITVSSGLKDGAIETTITDQGIGIPENLIGHIFDKFYRSHRSNVQVGGTGLGLYLCKSIVTAHGGNIWVKSKEGIGSTFGFSLPTYESVADQIKSGDNTNKGLIRRGAHGWIKNHSLYRR